MLRIPSRRGRASYAMQQFGFRCNKKSRESAIFIKILMKLFQKFPGFGAEPRGLEPKLTLVFDFSIFGVFDALRILRASFFDFKFLRSPLSNPRNKFASVKNYV